MIEYSQTCTRRPQLYEVLVAPRNGVMSADVVFLFFYVGLVFDTLLVERPVECAIVVKSLSFTEKQTWNTLTFVNKVCLTK